MNQRSTYQAFGYPIGTISSALQETHLTWLWLWMVVESGLGDWQSEDFCWADGEWGQTETAAQTVILSFFYDVMLFLFLVRTWHFMLPTTQPDHWQFAEILSLESVVSSRDEERGCRGLVNWLLSNSNPQIYFTFRHVVLAATDIFSEHLSDFRQLPLEIQKYPLQLFPETQKYLQTPAMEFPFNPLNPYFFHNFETSRSHTQSHMFPLMCHLAFLCFDKPVYFDCSFVWSSTALDSALSDMSPALKPVQF